MSELLRPMGRDILLKRCNSPLDPHENGSALVIVKRVLNAEILWFDVVAIGPRVIDVKPGDKVLVPLGQYTLPIIWESDRYVVTSI